MQLPNINKRKIENLLKEDKRLDGRKSFDYRDIEIETGISINAEGSARVRIGKTEVIAGVKLDTQEPYTDHEDEGTMITSMEYSPLCGERYESGPPKIGAIETARVVDRGIRESGFIDWKKLCIETGKRVWSIAIDIYCINDDGNVLDASALASIVALRVAKFPVYNKEEEKVEYGNFTENSLPLTENVPCPLTFHKIGEVIVLDPNREEEDASESRLTLGISCPNKDKIINSMQKGKIDALSEADLRKIIEQTEIVYDKLVPEIDKKIKELGN